MSEKDPRKRAHLFGSAGMAASGMVPKSQSKEPTVESYGILRKPAEETEAESDDEVEESDVAPSEEEILLIESEEDPEIVEEVPEVTDEESPEIESEESSAESAEDVEASAETEIESEQEPEDDENPAVATVVDLRSESDEFASVKPALKVAILSHQDDESGGTPHEMLFHHLNDVKTIAIADSDPARLQRTQTMMGAAQGYEDYRELLEKEDLDAVAVSSTDSRKRFEMVKAALEAGLHVVCGSRFTRTLKEAHELNSLAEEKKLKLAVVNPISCDPHLNALADQVPAVIGDLLEIRAYGKMGACAGGEDLLVNAPTLFDLIRLFAGEITWCSAQVTHNGEWAMRENIYEKENSDLGPILGDRIQAHFETESGVGTNFVSAGKWGAVAGQYGLELIGTESILKIHAGHSPALSLWNNPEPQLPEREDRWSLWPEGTSTEPLKEEGLTGQALGVRRVVRDWLNAIQNDAELHCSATRATKALEMVHGVWQAGITGKRAYFPLVNRLHPLSSESL